jgi:hypothetical protein
VLADTARVLALLARPRRLRTAPGELRELEFPGPDDARAAVGGLVLSAAPGSYLVDSDEDRLVLHVLVDGPPQLPETVTAG